MGRPPATDLRIAALATRQYGVVSRAEPRIRGRGVGDPPIRRTPHRRRRGDERRTRAPARTLLDLAATHPRRVVERAVDEAEVLRLFDGRAMRAVLRAHPNARGARRLAAVLDEHVAASTLTRTELEELFLRFCDAHGFDRPQVNRDVAGLEVDFLWPERRLGVEVDGLAFHRTRPAFERDHERDAVPAIAGVRVLRFTDRQIRERPAEVAGALRAARGE